ncbi:MAG: porin family protein [Bacteroidota bacterium]
MKKTLLIMKKASFTFIFLFINFISFSQFNVELGLKGGLNVSYNNIDDFDTESITSYHAGVFGSLKLGKIGIQPEILFSDQGAEVDFGPLGESDIELLYINVPIMGKYYLIEGVNLQFGPQLSFLLDSELDDTGIELETTDTDFGLAFGAGWDAPFGLKVDARFILGLTDINDSSDIDFSQVDIQNRNFQLSVGYRLFKIGKG